MPTTPSSPKPSPNRTLASGEIIPSKADYYRAFNADSKSVSEYKYMVSYREWYEKWRRGEIK